MNWNSTNNKRVLGDVAVEPDGSVYFAAPANTFVYFQALDENKMMVQSMRSGTIVQPGETVGCTGCHEHRLTSGAAGGKMAYHRPPRRIEPWRGSPRDFNYLNEVQPIFDRNCVSCHDYGKPAGVKLNLAGDLNPLFNTSYCELHAKSALRWSPDQDAAPKLLIKAVHDGPPAVLPPCSWGSHRSRLVDVIRKRHEGVELGRDDVERITTWIDLNAPYYGSYATTYGDNAFGRSPLDAAQMRRLHVLTGPPSTPSGIVAADKLAAIVEINFTRPELSACLARLKPESQAYREALAILNTGKAALARQPREDMPGFQVSAAQDRARLARYKVWAEHEADVRAAILLGDRIYDSP